MFFDPCQCRKHFIAEAVVYISFLSLSRSGGRSARSASRDGSIAAVLLLFLFELVWVRKRQVFHGDKSFLSGVSPRSSGNSLLSVGCEVEGDEEEQVRAENTHASEGGKFLSGASTIVWSPWEIAVSEVGVGCEVDEEQVDDELNDLEHGDVLLPPDADAARRLEVVPGICQCFSSSSEIVQCLPIHNHVDRQVECNGHPRD